MEAPGGSGEEDMNHTSTESRSRESAEKLTRLLTAMKGQESMVEMATIGFHPNQPHAFCTQKLVPYRLNWLRRCTVTVGEVEEEEEEDEAVAEAEEEETEEEEAARLRCFRPCLWPRSPRLRNRYARRAVWRGVQARTGATIMLMKKARKDMRALPLLCVLRMDTSAPRARSIRCVTLDVA